MDNPNIVGNFTFTLTDVTGGTTSVTSIETQSSTVVEANGLRCRDVSDGDTEICNFTIGKFKN